MGGNQPKVVIAKWFGHQSKIIILDEPTKGHSTLVLKASGCMEFYVRTVDSVYR